MSLKHQPRKRFGQNFLVDQGVIAAILAAIAPARSDALVEIGPGLGALTKPLLDAVDVLHVVEIDRDLVARLRGQFFGRVVVHEGDALTFDFSALAAQAASLRIVGNLPYNISTPLLFHLAQSAAVVRDMHFMLQKEVVERAAAAPGGHDYGRLSVMLQYRFHVEPLFNVPPQAFEPAPKVDSAVLRLIPRSAADLAARDEAAFARVVRQAFSQRRKMLRNTLRPLFAEEQLAALNIAPSARAEELAVADFVRLGNALAG